MSKTMNHGEYQKALRSKDIASLYFIIKDCRETIDANPQGSNVGYYLDEMHYAGMEIRRRQNGGK